jgi:hypothetical protein
MEAEAGDEVFAVDAGGGPGGDDLFCEFGDGEFGFVVDRPAVVLVVVGEDGKDHGAGLAHDDGDVVADGVEGAGFAGDGGAGFAGVDGFEVARDGLAVELVFEHVEGYGADGEVSGVGRGEAGGVGSGRSSLLVEMAEADGFHERSHLAGRGFAKAELWLIRGHGAGGGLHYFLVEVGVEEAEGLHAGVDGVEAEAVDGEVGGGVVGDDDHEGEDVFEGEGNGGVEEGEDAGAADGLAGVEGDGFVPAGFAVADVDHGLVEDRELDDGGGLDGEVGVDGYGFIGVELGGVEGDAAEASGGARGGELLEQLLKGRGGSLCGSGHWGEGKYAGTEQN